MKRILVTGAGGFVGRHCLPELLARGFEVHGTLSPRAQAPAFPRQVADHIAWHAVDLLDHHAVHRMVQRVRPTHLLHLAWITTPGEYWTSPINHAWATASLQLLWSFRDARGERVVMTGSCAEYDCRTGICSESSTPIRPASAYGKAKHVVHRLLDEESAKTGLSAAWARLFFLYGPHGDPSRLPRAVIEPLLRGEPAPCSVGESQRDYLYITDAAAAICAVADSPLTGSINIASGQRTQVADMIRSCGQILGREELLNWGAHPSANEPPLIVGDVGRLQTELGWFPKVNLAEGLVMTIEWSRAMQGVPRAA
jgi:nucleoside-diphosphate-sugar epimerase